MSVVDAPRLVSSDASPPVPEWAVTRTTWSSGAGLVAACSVQIARATLSFTAQGAHLAPLHPRHEEEPRDHGVELAALEGDLVRLDAAAAGGELVDELQLLGGSARPTRVVEDTDPPGVGSVRPPGRSDPRLRSAPSVAAPGEADAAPRWTGCSIRKTTSRSAACNGPPQWSDAA